MPLIQNAVLLKNVEVDAEKNKVKETVNDIIEEEQFNFVQNIKEEMYNMVQNIVEEEEQIEEKYNLVQTIDDKYGTEEEKEEKINVMPQKSDDRTDNSVIAINSNVRGLPMVYPSSSEGNEDESIWINVTSLIERNRSVGKYEFYRPRRFSWWRCRKLCGGHFRRWLRRGGN